MIVNGYVEVYNELVRSKNLQQVFDIRTRESEALIQSIDIADKLFKTGRATYLYKALGGGWR